MRTDEFSAGEGASDERQDDGDARRERSTVEFPYMDLDQAMAVARAVFARNGQGECSHDELAAQMDLSATSSGIRTRIATARVFSLIHSERGSESVKLTELGLRAIDSTTERKAKAEAFLKVELFRKVYEHYRGKQLPPAAALQRELQHFGVAPKQAERARQTMERSASQAGYFESGRDRLVRPAGIGGGGESESASGEGKPADDRTPSDGGGSSGGGGGGGGREIDPIITALLAHLPPPKTVWPSKEREAWLNLLRGSLGLIYKDASADGPKEQAGQTASARSVSETDEDPL